MPEMLYVLVALLNATPGEVDSFVIDHSLTYEDCQRRLETGPIFTKPTIRKLQSVTLACEPEE